MEKRHIAVWIGLVLNLIFLGIISYIPSALEPYRDQLDYQMQQMIEVLPYVKILMTAEMAPYQDEPKQMQSGAIGKSGYLKLRFAKREYRSEMVEMERRVPSLVQRALYWDEMMPQMPCVTMISTSGVCL